MRATSGHATARERTNLAAADRVVDFGCCWLAGLARPRTPGWLNSAAQRVSGGETADSMQMEVSADSQEHPKSTTRSAALLGLLEQPRHSGFESVTKTNQRFAVAPSGAMACIADNQRHIHAYVYS